MAARLWSYSWRVGEEGAPVSVKAHIQPEGSDQVELFNLELSPGQTVTEESILAVYGELQPNAASVIGPAPAAGV